MTNRYEGTVRGFFRLTKAPYFVPSLLDEDTIEEFVLGAYVPDGGCVSEFKVSWVDIRLGPQPIALQLKAFSDGFQMLSDWKDFTDMLATIDDQYVTPDEFQQKLFNLGFVDMHQIR